MRIFVVTPARPGSRNGNRVTALRWVGILRRLGHAVRLGEAWDGAPCDVLVALHARKSHASVARWREARPRGPLVVALTGTDLYDELDRSPEAQDSLERATRLVTLQPLGIQALPPHVRGKARAIVQSASAPPRRPPPADGVQICVLAHLRSVKDPFLAARAVRRLPERSRVHVLHCGSPLDAGSEDRARAEMAANPRWSWVGPRPRAEALRTLAASRALVVSSRHEGGANVVSEAIACGVPVLSTWIAGSVGILGADYPGFYPVGDDAALAALMLRLEEDPAFEADLRARIAALRPLVAREREEQAWRALIEELRATAPARIAGDGEGAA
ncbi:MAG TPA: selenoneine biosynthesis selenosugar synthase SenB [Anaeromyxobacter sp.]|nr:selenoneine biosynthesis selenosugar synthase SenB [Anaeromyxobacter sp.]